MSRTAQVPGAPTLLCSHLVKIRPSERQPRGHDALLEEISRTSALVSLECPLRRGTKVHIDCESCELRGKVVGCTKSPMGYMAKVTFPKDSPWAPARFKPDGMFNPNFLVCGNPKCTPECTNGSCGATREPGQGERLSGKARKRQRRLVPGTAGRSEPRF